MRYNDKYKQKPKGFDESKPKFYEEEKPDENVVCGRNAVLELLRSGRSVDKLFIKKGGIEGSLIVIIGDLLKGGITALILLPSFNLASIIG